jgi:hypothetical protein
MQMSEIPKVDGVPKGYRMLGYFKNVQTPKGALFDYYGWRLWVPKNVLVWCAGRFHAPGWAIRSAKEFMQKHPRDALADSLTVEDAMRM